MDQQMDWQYLTTLLLIGSACAYLAHRGWKAFGGSKGNCGGGCGCAKAPESDAAKEPVLIPPEELVLRR